MAQNESRMDTIAAVITPPGEGGVAAVRVAGPLSVDILGQVFHPLGGRSGSMPPPFRMRYGTMVDGDGHTLDEVMAVYMPAGRSYTGLHQVEIFCHGGRLIVRRILDEILAHGARAAEPGEFTKLAFLNGRIDLSRAEAVAEMIAANTYQSLKASREHLLGAYTDHIAALRERLVRVLAELEASIDMSEEEIDPAETRQLAQTLEQVARDLDTLAASYRGGRILREGFVIAIAGRPNAGKSSLFNRLLAQERALVDPEAGTTRDYLAEWIDLDGFAVNLVDTAGLRDDGGSVEQMGQARSRERVKAADLLLWLVDVAEAGWEKHLADDLSQLEARSMFIVGNKVDLLEKVELPEAIVGQKLIPTSCVTEAGLSELRGRLVDYINIVMPDLTSGLIVTSARHKEKIEQA
ncbi:tRNA uridine-5-carboxymethylaminomethyl(34) synthesis GTPase MnmE, partial [candidate division GN15 bacterium]|nr:tRNA uridine-5-carboxymethylaminomethyl(34) synthesis GTPase MnmE [candidate division GN15 bacterium]